MSNPILNHQTYGSYGYNAYHANGKDFTQSLRLASLKRASGTIMLAECRSGLFPQKSYCRYTHNNVMNGAFYDGHVKGLHKSEVPADSDLFWTGK